MPDFALGTLVEFRTTDGAEFRGVLRDFTEDYFTIEVAPRERPEDLRPGGLLGFPFETVQMMWPAA